MMTAVGRGRGNWGSKDLSAPLRRPGEAPRLSSGDDDIMKELASLDINDSLKIEVVESQIKKYCANREQLWKICQRMYESGAKDRNMVPKVVKFWKNLSSFEVNDVKLRSVLMSTAQKDFEEREKIRKDDPERFLNAVALFGGIFHNVTLPGGGIFNVLVSPMIEYLELLLKEVSKDSRLREAELEMLATQVNLNGPLLHEQVKGTLDAFNCQVRDILATTAPSLRCKYWLLLVTDLSTHGWNVQELPDYLKTFYAEKLGKSFDLLTADVSHISRKSEPSKPVNKIIDDSARMVPKEVEVKLSEESRAPSRDFGGDRPYRRSQPDGDAKERRKPDYWGHDDRFEGGRGGGGGKSWRDGEEGRWRKDNWRDRGDGATRKDFKRHTSNDSQSTYASPPPAAQEESWD